MENLSKSYSIPLKYLFTILIMLPMLAIVIAVQLLYIFRNGIYMFYVIMIGMEFYFLLRMSYLLKIYLSKITVSEEGISYKEFLSTNRKYFLWENVKRFKYKSVNKKNVTLYILENKKGDRITFNNMFRNWKDLVTVIQEKSNCKLIKND